MGNFKIGIIGAGLIAETAHIPAVLKCRNAELSVIIESSPGRVNELKKNPGLDVTIIRELKDLNQELDGIIICTPNNSHKDLAVSCLEKGINVLIEKPLATKYSDALEIQKKAGEKGLTVMTGFCTRFWPGVKYVKELIGSRALGKVKRFVFQYGAAGGWAPVSNYITSKEAAGGGAFVINGSHYLDRMLWYFGKPASFSYSDDFDGGIEANSLAEFVYENNSGQFKGILRVSKTVRLEPGCVIEFEQGTIVHRDWSSPSVTLRFNGLNNMKELTGKSDDFDAGTRPDMYLLQLEEFIRLSSDHGSKGISDLADAVEAVKITEDLYGIRQPFDCHWYNFR